MSVRLYMDVHVDARVTRELRRKGIDVLTAQDDGTTRATDPDLLDRASSLDRVLYTNDTDFLVEAARRQANGEPFAGVIFARQTLAVGDCVAGLEMLAQVGKAEDFTGLVWRLPLR